MPSALLVAAVLASTPPLGPSMSDDARKEAIRAASREELAQAMRDTPPETLIAMGLAVIDRLGTYRYRMEKRERIGGALRDAQQIDTYIREAPWAVRLHYVGGPAKGRKVVYNPKVNKDEFRVREAGFFKIVGAIWIDTDSSLAKADSNHTIKEAGLGNLLQRFRKDLDRGKAFGGFGVEHEGFDDQGHYCMVWVSPNGGQGFDSAKTRICTDLEAGIPGRVEGYDCKGTLLESYRFSGLTAEKLHEDFFNPEKAP